MNKSVIIIIVVVAVVVLGIPLASQLMKSSETADSDSSSEPASDPAPAAPSLVPDRPAPGRAAPAPNRAAASGLNANTLPNTVWGMKLQGADVTVTFLPGGTLQAQSPLLRAYVGSDTIQGRWSCSGNTVNISANAGGQSVSARAVIQGNQLIVNGSAARRIR